MIRPGPKRLGCCLGCDREVYEVVGYHTEGPLTGHPNRLGAMLPHGLQVEFLLSNGVQIDVAFCRQCAQTLHSDEYQAVWEACLARAKFSYETVGRSQKEILLKLGPQSQMWPVAMTLWRKEAPEFNQLVLARREEG